MEIMVLIQYILTATQSFGSQNYCKKSQMTILGGLLVYYSPGGAGALECNLTGGAHFLRIFTTCLGKNLLSIPCFRIIRLQKIPKIIGKTIVYCS